MNNQRFLVPLLCVIALLLGGIFVQNQLLLSRLTTDAPPLPSAARFQATKWQNQPQQYGLVPVNADGSVNVRIQSAERLGVSIEDISTFDNLEVTLDEIDTYDELEVDIQEVGNSSVSNGAVPVRVRN